VRGFSVGDPISEDEHTKLAALHDFFMKPPLPGKPSRADQLDEILNGYRTGKMSIRAFIWLCGVVVAIAAAYSAVKGWNK